MCLTDIFTNACPILWIWIYKQLRWSIPLDQRQLKHTSRQTTELKCTADSAVFLLQHTFRQTTGPCGRSTQFPMVTMSRKSFGHLGATSAAGQGLQYSSPTGEVLLLHVILHRHFITHKPHLHDKPSLFPYTKPPLTLWNQLLSTKPTFVIHQPPFVRYANMFLLYKPPFVTCKPPFVTPIHSCSTSK